MGTLFIQTRETTDGTWLYIKDALKQVQTLLYHGDKFELFSLQYVFDQGTKPNMFTIVKFQKRKTAKLVNAGNNRFLISRLYEKKIW